MGNSTNISRLASPKGQANNQHMAQLAFKKKPGQGTLIKAKNYIKQLKEDTRQINL